MSGPGREPTPSPPFASPMPAPPRSRPIVKRLLSPRGDVVYDTRTNTLIIVD